MANYNFTDIEGKRFGRLVAVKARREGEEKFFKPIIDKQN